MAREIQKNISDLEYLDELEDQYFSHFDSIVSVVKKIYDKQLFKVRGYSSFVEYAENRLNMSKSAAYRNLKIAKSQKQLPPGGISESEYTSLGTKKLDAINSLDPELWAEIMGGEKVDLNGRELDFYEIKKMAAVELEQEVRKHKKALKNKTDQVARLTEDKKLLKSERDSYKREAEDNKNLELKYGARASKLDDKRRCMDHARKCLADASQWLHQINCTEDDPQPLQQDAADLIRRFDQAHKNALAGYGFLADILED